MRISNWPLMLMVPFVISLSPPHPSKKIIIYFLIPPLSLCTINYFNVTFFLSQFLVSVSVKCKNKKQMPRRAVLSLEISKQELIITNLVDLIRKASLIVREYSSRMPCLIYLRRPINHYHSIQNTFIHSVLTISEECRQKQPFILIN